MPIMSGARSYYEESTSGIRILSFVDKDHHAINGDSVRHFFAIDFLAWAGDQGHILIDLAGVPYLDSAALGPLIQALRKVRASGGSIALCNIQASGLREILALTRFDHIFPIYDNRANAIRELTTAA